MKAIKQIIAGVLALTLGFAAGAEWGGSALLSTEHASHRRRGFFGSFTQVGSAAGLLLATGALAVAQAAFGPEAFAAWGWRVPFLASAVLVVIGLVIRLGVEDAWPVLGEPYLNWVIEDKFAAGMSEFGGTVLQTSLSDEDEKALAEELA